MAWRVHSVRSFIFCVVCGYENSRLIWRSTLDLLLLFCCLCLLGQKNSLDVGKNSALSDCNSRQQFVQFLVVTDSQLKMTRYDSRFLVVSGSISSQFQDFSRQVLQDSGQVHWCSASNSWRESSLSQESVNSTDWELKSSSEWSGLGLRLSFSSFSTSRHDSDERCLQYRINELMNLKRSDSAFIRNARLNWKKKATNQRAETTL